MKKRIFLVSNHPDDATFVSQVSAQTGAELEVLSSMDDTVDKLLTSRPECIFMDVSKIQKLHEFEEAIQTKVGMFTDLIRPHQIYMLGDHELNKSRDLVRSPFFSSYYRRPIKDIAESGEFFGRFVKMNEFSEIYDLANFFSQQAEIQRIVLNHTAQKQDAVEAVRQYLIKAKIPARIANGIGNSVDELLMNAMFDAPCDAFGKPIFTSTSRTHERPLHEREKVEMHVGFDGFNIGVSVIDQYGSVNRQRLLNHVSSNYREQDYNLKQGQAGAGLRLSNIYRAGASLIYHCDVHRKTQATLLYRAYPTYREFKSQFNFFSVKFYD